MADMLDLLKAGALLFGRDPVRTFAAVDALREQQQNRSALKNAFGPDQSDGITWNGPRGMPSGNFQLMQDQQGPTQPGMAQFPPLPQRGFSPDLQQSGQSEIMSRLMQAPEMQKLVGTSIINNQFAPPTAHDVPEGGSLVFTDRFGRPVGSPILGQAKMDDFTRELEAAGIKRGTPEFTKAIQDKTAKANYIPEMDPLTRALNAARIGEANSATAKNTATVGMMQGGNIPDEVINGMADQYLAGDKSVFSQLGRGVQGSANISRLRTAIEQRGIDQGLSPAARAAKLAEFSANTAGMRTAAQAGAKMDTLATEVEKFAQQALETSRKVNRSNFIPLTKAEQMIEQGSSDPDLADFVAANTSLVNTYSAVANRGTPTVSSQHHAYDMLSTAMGQDAYERVVNRLLKETAAAKASPSTTMMDIRKRIDSGGDVTPAPAANVQTWTRDKNGKPVKAN